MAQFIAMIPDEELKQLEKISKNAEKMLGEMTTAGAEVVEKNIIANAPEGIKQEPELMKTLKLSKVYKTPSDDGINTKVAFFYGFGDAGYFINRNGVKTPIPLVLNMFEFGSRKREYPKKPFIRKSFRKSEIDAAMKKVQEKYLKGTILDE